ncbi:hypothetical protein HMPREF9946_02023 [Acetobacteraceae bacterium AT-5844]|nr:hypothetical protein HMPREF9946_02023 [Acetobacteraceae bacterium AT-5844]
MASSPFRWRNAVDCRGAGAGQGICGQADVKAVIDTLDPAWGILESD